MLIQGYKRVGPFTGKCARCGESVRMSRTERRKHEQTRTHLEATEGKTLPNHAVVLHIRSKAEPRRRTGDHYPIVVNCNTLAEGVALEDAIKRGLATDPTQHNGDTITRLSDLVDGTPDEINATIARLNRADIPNDPEEMNEARAAWAAYALAAFGASHRSDPDNLLPDLLCDLRHWCDRNGQDFDAELARGNMHYEAEIAAEVQP